MSKRLSKRQQREQEELELLKAQERSVIAEQGGEEAAEQAESGGEEVEVEERIGGEEPVNLFAALGDEEVAGEEDSEEDEQKANVEEVKRSTKKKNKKKKKKKTAEHSSDVESPPQAESSMPAGKKKKQMTYAEDQQMDEVDRALAELGISHAGNSESTAASGAGPSDIRKSMAFRNLLSVDPKNLDADAELRRFFGSKVIASGNTSSKNHRAGPSSKLRYTISKPKPGYPPATSLSGLVMREMRDTEVEDMYKGKGVESEDKSEKWFTFEHSGAWREIVRQFLGAVTSHDPNTLMALLQVYPWHVDTLLQMSEVYRLQSDIGAASDFAERALYAFDRCLFPSFNPSTGSCRLDFDRVENRPLFLGLHRIISYLGRRGCWITAFNFAKLLFSLDPIGDPHGASFWLDFLAVKSGNGEWLIQMLEQASVSTAAAAFHGYPGMAYAQALALRADETAKKHGDHSESDAALQDAIKTFPQVVIPLADKIGATVPDSSRSHPLLQIQASYTPEITNVVHLLSHIYVSRSEALWKEPSVLSWFQTQVSSALPQLDTKESVEARDRALAHLSVPRDPNDRILNVPMHICRHVLCSESTSWLGFLPPQIKNAPVHAYDPLPPSTASTLYDPAYFNGLRPSRQERENQSEMTRLMEQVTNLTGRGMEIPQDILERLARRFAPPGVDAQALQGAFRRAAAEMGRGQEGGGTEEGEMPGAFPGA
ncbi:transcriptional repressor TCF25-domain-containing protein [Kockovaella imperatae]|uniref:Transcriptional repressor TCF25-domain-containing protein n=1 Tax=Kockovaella imperatae TaxID=4999 RepID=A0A1Y1USP5_9TREE|nr:transcriptional repressor TCF25-domain-containing protein [Kockovaella imperatae]ORX41043.1 transcriptional repressor TCF25-domain-containing protein [Kockovaella imperatae]